MSDLKKRKNHEHVATLLRFNLITTIITAYQLVIMVTLVT